MSGNYCLLSSLSELYSRINAVCTYANRTCPVFTLILHFLFESVVSDKTVRALSQMTDCQQLACSQWSLLYQEQQRGLCCVMESKSGHHRATLTLLGFFFIPVRSILLRINTNIIINEYPLSQHSVLYLEGNVE
jgi:hypothetical protein